MTSLGDGVKRRQIHNSTEWTKNVKFATGLDDKFDNDVDFTK